MDSSTSWMYLLCLPGSFQMQTKTGYSPAYRQARNYTGVFKAWPTLEKTAFRSDQFWNVLWYSLSADTRQSFPCQHSSPSLYWYCFSLQQTIQAAWGKLLWYQWCIFSMQKFDCMTLLVLCTMYVSDLCCKPYTRLLSIFLIRQGFWSQLESFSSLV